MSLIPKKHQPHTLRVKPYKDSTQKEKKIAMKNSRHKEDRLHT
jgi:hypothetical protein